MLFTFTYVPLFEFSLEHHIPYARYLLRFYEIGAVVLAVAVLVYRGNLERLAKGIAIGAVLLVLFNAGSVIYPSGGSAPPDAPSAFTAPTGGLPDIYYLIFDAYGRDDVLDDRYGFDNSPFLDSLRERGFYVADQSIPNYTSLNLSMASSLNMRYLLEGEQYDEITQDNAVLRTVKSFGYDYVHFDSGQGLTRRNAQADIQFLDKARRQLLMNQYTKTLFRSTTLSHISRALGVDLDPKLEGDQRERFLSNIRQIRTVTTMSAPTFTFIHNVPPHNPNHFDRSGNPAKINANNDYNLDTEIYIDEVIFVNKTIIEIVDDILDQSEIDPIIIIQSDHGPSKDIACKECGRHKPSDYYIWAIDKILNAYHLPDYCEQGLYPGISPVNTFRVIFNTCFGADFALLEDLTFTGPDGSPPDYGPFSRK